jgi:hypothetical protein
MIDAARKTKAKVAVTSIFPAEERQRLYVHLDSFDWDFPVFGPVLLHVGPEVIRMRYTGFANLDGTATLQLVPADPRYKTVQEIRRVLGEADPRGLYHPGGAYVERASE